MPSFFKIVLAALLVVAGLWFATDMATGFNPYRNALMLFASMTCILSAMALLNFFSKD